MQYLGNELAKLHDFRPGSVRDERASECPKAGGGALGWGEAHRLQSLSSHVACLLRVAHLGMDLCKACQTESPVPVVTGRPVPPGVGKEPGPPGVAAGDSWRRHRPPSSCRAPCSRR